MVVKDKIKPKEEEYKMEEEQERTETRPKKSRITLQRKVKNSQDKCANMFSAVQDVQGWRSGVAPAMLTVNGTVTRYLKKMANILRESYSTKLEEVNEKLGPPKGNYLQVTSSDSRQIMRIANATTILPSLKVNKDSSNQTSTQRGERRNMMIPAPTGQYHSGL